MCALADFIELHMWPHIRRRESPAAEKHYKYLFDKFILPSIGRKDLCAVEPRDCQAVVDLAWRKYSLQTLTHIRNAMRAVFNVGWKHGGAPRAKPGPQRRPAARTGERKRESYTDDQLFRLLMLLPDTIYAIALLAATAALRPGQLTGLKQGHCSLKEATLHANALRLPPFTIAIEGKSGIRGETIDSALAARLTKIIAKNALRGPEAPVFRSRTGTPINANNIEKQTFGLLEKDLGFPVTWIAFTKAGSALGELVAQIRNKKQDSKRANGRAAVWNASYG